MKLCPSEAVLSCILAMLDLVDNTRPRRPAFHKCSGCLGIHNIEIALFHFWRDLLLLCLLLNEWTHPLPVQDQGHGHPRPLGTLQPNGVWAQERVPQPRVRTHGQLSGQRDAAAADPPAPGATAEDGGGGRICGEAKISPTSRGPFVSSLPSIDRPRGSSVLLAGRGAMPPFPRFGRGPPLVWSCSLISFQAASPGLALGDEHATQRIVSIALLCCFLLPRGFSEGYWQSAVHMYRRFFGGLILS